MFYITSDWINYISNRRNELVVQFHKEGICSIGIYAISEYNAILKLADKSQDLEKDAKNPDNPVSPSQMKNPVLLKEKMRNEQWAEEGLHEY